MALDYHLRPSTPRHLLSKVVFVFLPIIIALSLAMVYVCYANTKHDSIDDVGGIAMLRILSLSVAVYVVVAKFIYFYEEYSPKRT